MKRFFLPVLLSLFSLTAVAQQVAKMTPDGIGFLQYLPDGYSSNSNKYPVVVSLHGIKEKGDNLSSVKIVANVGLPKYVKYGQKYPFILISPQLKRSMGRWSGDYVMRVVNYVKKTLRVDPNRIYLTGLSLGGGGVWSVATSSPDTWAAILPICSGYNVTSGASKIAASKIPTWGFHGDADHVVSEGVTVKMINSINNYKPSPMAKVTIYRGLGHVIWDRVYKSSDALNWMLSYRNGSSTQSSGGSTSTNSAPVANAGSDKTLTLPSKAVTLYGSASDEDGSIKSYTWSKKSGGSASMSGSTSKTLKLSNLAQGSYVFSLLVKDDKGATDTDEVKVTVNKNTSSETNEAPVANAGSDRTLTLPSNSTTLYGAGSDKDGSIKSYTWSKKSGGYASMSGTTSKTLKLSNLKEGAYVFSLLVKDNDGRTDTDDVKVTVKGTSSEDNAAPVANAGTDRLLTLPSNATTLYGGGSDKDGSIRSYTWTKISGGSVSMSGSTTKTLKLSSLREGRYIFSLAVKDDKGATDTDKVLVLVKSGTTSGTKNDNDNDNDNDNAAPVANAGTDRSLTSPANSTAIFGGGSDKDGSIKSYTWTKKSGGNAKMVGASTKTLRLSGLKEGTYIFSLQVRDDKGATDTDEVRVTIRKG